MKHDPGRAKQPAIGVLDLGASGGRVYALARDDAGLNLREIVRFEHAPQRYWQRASQTGEVALRLCWDMGRIYAGLLDGLAALAGCADLALESFGIDTWGSDGAWVNAAGDMLGLVGAGRDHRWQEALAEINARIAPRDLFRLTGTRSEPFCVLNQLYWYTHHQPALVSAAALYMPLGSLLHYFLCGERAAERTWMSTTQLNRPGEAGYNVEVFARLGLPLEKMPPLVGPGTRLGRCHAPLAAGLGLPPFEVIVPATHDTASAYAAAPVRPGCRSILISSGTFALVGVPQARPLVSDAAFDAGLTNIGGGAGEVFLHDVTMGNWPAQELRREWARQDGRSLSWRELDEMAASAPPCQAALDIDHELFRAPASMEEAVAAYCRETGQRPPLDRPGTIRAVYEGLAARIARACTRIQSLSGNAAGEILVVGGGARNRLVNQWLADAAGLPVRTGSDRAAAAGNALVQARALGWIGSLAEGRALLRDDGREEIYLPQKSCQAL